MGVISTSLPKVHGWLQKALGKRGWEALAEGVMLACTHMGQHLLSPLFLGLHLSCLEKDYNLLS